MIKQIGHLAFVVKNMDQALHFYCDILGFHKHFELHTDEGDPWIVYLKVREGQFIELFYGGKNKTDQVQHQIGYSHLCLEVDNIYDISNHLKNNGIILDVEPKQGKDTNYQCWVTDPDGNRIEFMQMSPDSPQMRQ